MHSINIEYVSLMCVIHQWTKLLPYWKKLIWLLYDMTKSTTDHNIDKFRVYLHERHLIHFEVGKEGFEKCFSLIIVIQSLSHVWLFATTWTAAGQASLPFTLAQFPQTHVHWCHPTISFSAVHFSSCLESILASGSFPMSQLFTSGRHRIGASAKVLSINIQDWFP